MAKLKSKFICQSCGYETYKWLGRCPACNEWNSFVEELYEKNNQVKVELKDVKVEKLCNIEIDMEERILTNIGELDRVLGGGIVNGSLILVGGDPGIGKSTLLIQVACRLANSGLKVLYVSGEESPKQIKIREDRLGLKADELYILSETNLDIINNTVDNITPDILIIDSIQTVYNPSITSAPGSVSQVREATHEFMKVAKKKGIATFIVGHVTKDGSIAGPRVLEHMVDTVLYFEGEMYQSYRILRAVKNRFGSTNEIGMFEMRDIGLVEVKNPSEVLILGRPKDTSGTVVVPSIEGTRPMLVEVQSLVSHSAFGMPRRATTGIDYNRAILMIAVLEKRLGFNMQDCDVYINVVGGLQTKEPAMDLGIITSIASSYKDIAIDSNTILMGEVGLTGEIRRVSYIDKRIKEAANLGFNRVIVPEANLKGLSNISGIEIKGVSQVEEALEIVLGGNFKW